MLEEYFEDERKYLEGQKNDAKDEKEAISSDYVVILEKFYAAE
jgi:hypothetical protein